MNLVEAFHLLGFRSPYQYRTESYEHPHASERLPGERWFRRTGQTTRSLIECALLLETCRVVYVCHDAKDQTNAVSAVSTYYKTLFPSAPHLKRSRKGEISWRSTTPVNTNAPVNIVIPSFSYTWDTYGLEHSVSGQPVFLSVSVKTESELRKLTRKLTGYEIVYDIDPAYLAANP